MPINNEFDSEFCNVKFVLKDNLVLLAWKKFASFDNYRQPTLFALELLKQFPKSGFVIDARNGFEDEKDDLEWGFTVLLPAMSNTECEKVAMIMDTVNEIEEEMDLWTKEFMKYFIVKKVSRYEEAVKFINEK